MAIFCGNLAAGRTSTINGTGEQTRDYVYVENVVRANVLALEKYEVPSGAYNIGTGSETTGNEFYGLLLEPSGKDLAPEHSLAQGLRAASKLGGSYPRRARHRLAPRSRPHLRSQGYPPLFWCFLRGTLCVGVGVGAVSGVGVGMAATTLSVGL